MKVEGAVNSEQCEEQESEQVAVVSTTAFRPLNHPTLLPSSHSDLPLLLPKIHHSPNKHQPALHPLAPPLLTWHAAGIEKLLHQGRRLAWVEEPRGGTEGRVVGLR